MDLTSEVCFYIHSEMEVAGILLGNFLCFLGTGSSSRGGNIILIRVPGKFALDI